VCTELGYVDDPLVTDDGFDQCLADYELVVEVRALCAAPGLVDDPARSDDEFDQCLADHELVVEVRALCAALGLVDDPARSDDELDQCAIAHLPARVHPLAELIAAPDQVPLGDG